MTPAEREILMSLALLMLQAASQRPQPPDIEACKTMLQNALRDADREASRR